MSDFRVEITDIKAVRHHPNADRLDIVNIFGWEVVTSKDTYKVGDKVCYFPVDCIISEDLEKILFPPDSKIKLTNRRIKSIKLRGQISQGMIANPKLIGVDHFNIDKNVAEYLKCIKYEPPEISKPRGMQVRSKKQVNPNFRKYTDIQNYKYYNEVFQQGELVVITEKCHGTSWRGGWVKNDANTLWKKIRKLFGRLPEWEFVWGSHNVQIQNKLFHKGFYDVDVYSKMVKQYDLKNLIPKGYVLYGEIVGYNIQKNFHYDCVPGEHKLFLFDVKFNDKWLDYEDFKITVDALKLSRVPELFTGPYDPAIVDKLRSGTSILDENTIKEGIVIKTIKETECSLGRKILKFINDEYYLLKDGTDYH